MSEPYVLFQVAETTWGIPSADLQQLEMMEAVTRVPDSPPFVEGILHLRGQVVPVVNLRRLLHLEPAPYDGSTRLLVLRLDERVVALAVDSAREFVWFDSQAVAAPPQELQLEGADYVRGVVLRDDRMILILDPRRLLARERRA